MSDLADRPAAVTELDATALRDPADLRHHLDDLGALVVRGADLDRIGLLQLGASLGTLQAMARGDRPQLRVLDTDDRSRLARLEAPLNRCFHSDLSWWAGPGVPLTLLSAVRLGGRPTTTTQFLDAATALDRLTTGQRSRLTDARVHHHTDASRARRHPAAHAAILDARRAGPRARVRRWRLRRSVSGWTGPVVRTGPSPAPGTAWPAIARHPSTGRSVLRLGDHAWRLVGPTGPAGDALLDAVQARLDGGIPSLEHVWEPGDLLVWDNWRMLHRAGPPSPGHRRLERVVAISSEDPPR